MIKGDEDVKHKEENLVGEQLAGCGFNEIMNNSLTKAAYYDNLNHYHADRLVRIMNPLSNDLNVMRQTLLFGGLESVAYNVNRKNGDIRFFEFGNVYQFDPEKKNADNPMAAYREENHLALWTSGKRVCGCWAHPDEDTTFFEMKAYVQNILVRIGLPFGSVVFRQSENDIFQKGMQIETRAGKVLVEMGVVCQKLLKAQGIDRPVYYAELNWTQLMKATKKSKVLYKEISKYPAVSRDLALLLDKQVEFEAVETVAYQTDKKLLKRVELFDVYEGKNLPTGKKSYAVNFILQDETKTLTDKQIDALMTKLIANLKKKLGAELR